MGDGFCISRNHLTDKAPIEPVVVPVALNGTTTFQLVTVERAIAAPATHHVFPAASACTMTPPEISEYPGGNAGLNAVPSRKSPTHKSSDAAVVGVAGVVDAGELV